MKQGDPGVVVCDACGKMTMWGSKAFDRWAYDDIDGNHYCPRCHGGETDAPPDDSDGGLPPVTGNPVVSDLGVSQGGGE